MKSFWAKKGATTTAHKDYSQYCPDQNNPHLADVDIYAFPIGLGSISKFTYLKNRFHEFFHSNPSTLLPQTTARAKQTEPSRRKSKKWPQLKHARRKRRDLDSHTWSYSVHICRGGRKKAAFRARARQKGRTTAFCAAASWYWSESASTKRTKKRSRKNGFEKSREGLLRRSPSQTRRTGDLIWS